MQIGTGIKLLIGGGVGFLVGCCVTEDTKITAICHIKRRIVEALTGEKRPDLERLKVEPRYEKAIRYTDMTKKKEIEDLAKNLLHFDSKEEAHLLLRFMLDMVRDYKTVTVQDLVLRLNRNMTLDFAWSKYGWTSDMVGHAYVVTKSNTSNEANISIGNPIRL